MRLVPTIICALTVFALTVQSAWTAPLRPVMKPPVQPVPSWTGPPTDPHAKAGQWFQRPVAGGFEEEFRTHEFYDNVLEDTTGAQHGGGWAGPGAIKGRAVNIVSDAANNILAFDIDATITNDLPGVGQGRPGTNSHGEQWTWNDEEVILPMLGVKLTGEFAVDPNNLFGGPWAGPYREGTRPQIEAVNHDQLAWYCWTPDNDNQDLVPWGGYLVPTWDFGDIHPGQTVNRLLQFKVSAPGIGPDDPRYEILLSDEDLLLNRTTSLKISTWIDDLAIDTGLAYPGPLPLRSSDASVFCNVPEPGTVAMLVGAGLIGLLGYARRRRKS